MTLIVFTCFLSIHGFEHKLSVSVVNNSLKEVPQKCTMQKFRFNYFDILEILFCFSPHLFVDFIFIYFFYVISASSFIFDKSHIIGNLQFLLDFWGKFDHTKLVNNTEFFTYG